MDARARFTMEDGDLQLVDSVEKYNPNHDDRGRFGSTGGGAMRSDGSAALHSNLQPKLDAISEKIDALPKDRDITTEIANAKVGIASASKAPHAQGSAQALLNVHQALDRAANNVVGAKTPLAFKIKDIRTDVKFLADALQRA